MKEELKKYEYLNQDTLSSIINIYNQKPHTSTKYSPNFVFQKCFIDFYNNENVNESIKIYQYIKKNIQNYQQRYVREKNKKVKYKLNVGDIIYNSNENNSLCEVVEIKENGFCQLKNVEPGSDKYGQNLPKYYRKSCLKISDRRYSANKGHYITEENDININIEVSDDSNETTNFSSLDSNSQNYSTTDIDNVESDGIDDTNYITTSRIIDENSSHFEDDVNSDDYNDQNQRNRKKRKRNPLYIF